MKEPGDFITNRGEAYEYMYNLEVTPYKQAIIAIREYAEQFKPEWIDVKVRLPKNLQSVLFFVDQGDKARYTYSGYFFKDFFYFEGTDERYALDDKITYWMPTPNPPQSND